MSKTSHCVCSPNSRDTDPTIKSGSNDMSSPPLPPRTSRTTISPAKNLCQQTVYKAGSNMDKVRCNCTRPHSCPAEDGSPPIPPKSKFQINTKFDDRLRYNEKQKHELSVTNSRRQSRKSSRHHSTDGSKSRKKSRSKSRPTVKEDKDQAVQHSGEDKKYFMKNHDIFIEKNSDFYYKTNKEFSDSNVNAKLCKISENINESIVKWCPNISDGATNLLPCHTKPPDIIPHRSNSTKVTSLSACNTETVQKSNSKLRKFFGFWTKPKKPSDSSRVTMTTPEALKIMKTTEMSGRPRRSKSLHLISGLSPKTSMHEQCKVISPETKHKSSSILAVISPTTTRLKRNLLCISPKNSNASKKQGSTLPVTSNSKSILSDNCQQRPDLTSFAGVRISPVHLIASNSESCYQNKNQNQYTANHTNCVEVCRNHQSRTDQYEKGNFSDAEVFNATSCGSKPHVHGNVETPSQRKTPSQSVTNPARPVHQATNMCSSSSNSFKYRSSNDTNTCLCNNTYHHLCPSHPSVPSCGGCLHNIVHQFSPPNHIHCCYHNQHVWCLVPCCSEQVPLKQRSFCSCHIYHPSASPPANLPRHLPPPPPPPPGPSFSNNHQFSRRYRQSYSKTPPPSFHTHQLPCHDDHFYQEYNLTQLSDSRQKSTLSQKAKSKTYQYNGCNGFQNHQCCIFNHSKCSACGSLFYEEVGSQATHYNLKEVHKNTCSSTPTCDSVFDQKLISPNPLFTSPLSTEDSFNCRCLYNQNSHRHSETCGRHSNEMRIHGCRNSAHRSLFPTHNVAEKERSSSKRRKNSSHSCHGSNFDAEVEKHELSKTHRNSPAAMLPTTSMGITSESNMASLNCDLVISSNNTPNISNTINTMLTSSSVNQNDRKQQHFEPWRKTFHDNMMALRSLGWYWGPLNHLNAENLVQGRPDGTFLVRDSGNEAYFLSLTFRVLGTTYHTRIEYSQGKFSFWSQPESHFATTIVEFIDKAVAHSVSGKFHYFLQTNTPGQPPMEVSLLYPLSRYQIVQSLQHLSRFVILSNIRRDHVSQLELPQLIKSYLMEKQYYIDCIETFVDLTKDSEPLTYEPSGRTL